MVKRRAIGGRSYLGGSCEVLAGEGEVDRLLGAGVRQRKSNYAINPTPKLYLRSNWALLPARVIAALDFVGCVSFVVSAHRGFVGRLPQRCARRNEFGAAASVRSRARWRAVGLAWQRCRTRARYKL